MEYWCLFLPLLIAGQGAEPALRARPSLEKRLSVVRTQLDQGKHKALLAKYAATPKMDAFAACAGDIALRWWYLAHRYGLEPEAPSQQVEDKLETALKGLISSGSREAPVLLNLYWHEATFESFRTDRPSRVVWEVERNGKGEVMRDALGNPIRVRNEIVRWTG